MHFLKKLISECIVSSSIQHKINTPEHSDKASEQRSRSFRGDLFTSGDHTNLHFCETSLFRFSLKVLGAIFRLDFATRILPLQEKVPLLPQYNLSVAVLRPVEHLVHS